MVGPLEAPGQRRQDNVWHKSPEPWRFTTPLFFLVTQFLASHHHRDAASSTAIFIQVTGVMGRARASERLGKERAAVSSKRATLKNEGEEASSNTPALSQACSPSRATPTNH